MSLLLADIKIIILLVHKYILNGIELEHVFEEKDLGVIIDSELKFEEHIAEKVKKANIVAGLIQRSFSHLNSRVFKTLFGSFVRPHLEYASVVWSPHLKKHINLVEREEEEPLKGWKASEPSIYRAIKEVGAYIQKIEDGYDLSIYKHIHFPRVPHSGGRQVQTNSFFLDQLKHGTICQRT